MNQLQPGDLLFTAGSDGTPTDPGHVGMYIGSGFVIEAPLTGEPVMIMPLEGYWPPAGMVATSRPPGRRTRAVSASTSESGLNTIRLIEQVTPSTLPSRGGIAVALARSSGPAPATRAAASSAPVMVAVRSGFCVGRPPRRGRNGWW